MPCPLCNDRGFIIDDNKHQKKCLCQVKKELERFLAPVIQYKLVKTTDFTKFSNHTLIHKGSEAGYYSLVKSYLFKYYFETTNLRQQYSISTGISIMEDYLSPTELKHTYLYTIPLLFVDLTKYYSNKAMGEVVLYVLKQRQQKNLPFWVYVGNMKRETIEQIYGTALKDFVTALDDVNINNYSKEL